MPSISNILNALLDFLNEAQSLGVIKEFTLVPCEQQNDEAPLKAKECLSKFLVKLDSLSKVTECNDYPPSDSKMANKEKLKDNINSEHPTDKDLIQMQIETNEVESCSSSVTDHIEQENKSEFNSASLHSVGKANEVEMQISSKTEAGPVESPNTKNLVQITVDTNEMKRRIAAFISRKRKEVDEWNVQEFCGRSYIDEQDPAWEKVESCARVDAVFVPRRGCKSHIKVSKVRNICGPQTQSQSGAKKIKQEPAETEGQTNDASLQTIEERLLNMETHLRLKSDNNLRSNIFQRLKDLENRILLIESTSPEYIHHLPNTDYLSPKKKITSDKDKVYSNCSTEELRKKIQSLKESLKLKSPHIKSEPFF